MTTTGSVAPAGADVQVAGSGRRRFARVPAPHSWAVPQTRSWLWCWRSRRLTEEALQRLTEAALALDATTSGITSGARRRAISDVRVLLFSLQQLWMAQSRVLRSSEICADGLPETQLSGLRHAGITFDWCGSRPGSSMPLLGDTLSRQATAVSERLTLVAVVFFPLTVSTSFFGMNFGWLTAHIGSGPALLLLGVVLPCVLVAATVVAARWLTRD